MRYTGERERNKEIQTREGVCVRETEAERQRGRGRRNNEKNEREKGREGYIEIRQNERELKNEKRSHAE